ncbi:MAG: SGNH/GDSL hydrolase family protein [Gammaproteobacteria bacterium]
MRRLLFWSTLPLLLPQALWVRRRTPRFAAPAGAEGGRVEAPGTTAPVSGETTAAPSLRLVGLGDSIIAGVGATVAAECLTAQFARELAERRGAAVEWSNIGRIGATTTRVLRDLAQRLPPQPADLLLVSVGVNDVTSLRRRGEWSREVRALADTLTAHSPGAPALFLGLPPMQRFPALPVPLRNSLGMRARLFDETLAAALDGHPTARHLPLPLEASPEMFSGDGFHPSASAYALIARALADFLGPPRPGSARPGSARA